MKNKSLISIGLFLLLTSLVTSALALEIILPTSTIIVKGLSSSNYFLISYGDSHPWSYGFGDMRLGQDPNYPANLTLGVTNANQIEKDIEKPLVQCEFNFIPPKKFQSEITLVPNVEYVMGIPKRCTVTLG